MRSWILGLLLAVLPLQFAWASVAAYCRHQADVVGEHLGHHEHEHGAARSADDGRAADEGAVDPSAQAPADDGTGVDDDCAYCHLSGAQPLVAHVGAMTGAAAPPLVARVPLRFVSHEAGGLERPDWRRLARSASLEESRIR